MIRTTQRAPFLTDGLILGLSAFLTLPIAIIVPKGLVVLFVLTALLSLLAALAQKRRFLIPTGWGVRLAAAFATLCLASVMWSMTPEVSLKKALVLVLVLSAGLTLVFTARRLQGEEWRKFETGLILGVILGFSMLAIEVAFDSPLQKMLVTIKNRPVLPDNKMLALANHGAAVAAIVLPLWTLAVWRRKGPMWAAIGFAICCAILAFCQADSHKFALVTGLAAALIIIPFGRSALKGFSIFFIVGVLLAPWVVTMMPDPLEPNNGATFLPASSQHRLVIWQTTAGHILEHPLLGSGLNTSRAYYDRDHKVKHYFGGKTGAIRWTNSFEPIPLHPHNGVLQVWLELGAAGALILAAGLYFIVGHLAYSENNFERAMTFASFVVGLVIFSVSYGAWQSWWMGTIWLMMAFGTASLNISRSPSEE